MKFIRNHWYDLGIIPIIITAVYLIVNWSSIEVLQKLAFTLYLFPIIFPNVMWVGFTPVLFGMSQLIMHVLMTPRKIGNRVYSPGAGAVVLGHLPVGIYWLWYTISNGMLGWLDVVLGIIYLAVFIGGFMMQIGYGVLKKPDSPYAFPEEEFERGGYAERIRNCE